MRSIKPLRKAIQKLVDANQAAIDPPSSELLPTALQAGMLVWGYYKSDRVWYPGTVRETGGHLSVLFDDGDVDDELYDAYDPRPWRLRVDQGSGGLSSSGSIVGSSSSSSGISSSIGSSGQADPEPKRRRLAKESVPAVAPAVAFARAYNGAFFIACTRRARGDCHASASSGHRVSAARRCCVCRRPGRSRCISCIHRTSSSYCADQ